MMEFYPQIKLVHIAAIVCSGALFFLRGSSVLAGLRWPMASPVRYLSYTVDTVLLTAAMMLLTILPGEMFANGWLAVKVVLVVTYIVLGILALRPGRTRAMRAVFFAGALAVYAQIYFIARAHHPLGVFYLFG
ncbi:SirB2 family protein [Lysobacter sp. LF1]|uniref:SirB2 family protein n=1 Tax=Lysobacter stagni TaxID=3045172 RepID=A0ABT6XIH8_9GAMM|nr:SirB2 family protein [Lysobacter sp. LF1]MDI9239953.1 SirB2 family protein [Lysobacter sp. LF1]